MAAPRSTHLSVYRNGKFAAGESTTAVLNVQLVLEPSIQHQFRRNRLRWPDIKTGDRYAHRRGPQLRSPVR
ncbi:MAG TPA: hypothetical protein VLC91_03305, partial [Spongiibacteraceae bacterium]|nr:hypothetical protein [Spongiibacteraceae bacterium]